MNTLHSSKLRHTVVFTSIVVLVLVVVTSLTGLTLKRAAQEQTRLQTTSQQ